MNHHRRIVTAGMPEPSLQTLQERIDALAQARLVALESELAAQGYTVRTGIEVEFHVNNAMGPVYGALDLPAIEKEISQSPYIESVKSSGLHTLLPPSVADHYTQQYEMAIGSLTRQGRLRPPSVMARVADRLLASAKEHVPDYKTAYYAGQALAVDYHPRPVGTWYPADTQISVSVRDAQGQAVLREGTLPLRRAVDALLTLQHDAFECFAPLRDGLQKLPGATRHLRHSQRLSYHRHRDYSVHSIADDAGEVRLENRMIAPDVSTSMPMLLTVGAVWLGLQEDKTIPAAGSAKLPRSHAQATERMKQSVLLKEVLGPELYAACMAQQQARSSGDLMQR